PPAIATHTPHTYGEGHPGAKRGGNRAKVQVERNPGRRREDDKAQYEDTQHGPGHSCQGMLCRHVSSHRERKGDGELKLKLLGGSPRCPKHRRSHCSREKERHGERKGTQQGRAFPPILPVKGQHDGFGHGGHTDKDRSSEECSRGKHREESRSQTRYVVLNA